MNNNSLNVAYFSNETEVVEAVRIGNKKIFEHLYKNYFPAFVNYVKSQNGNEQDAKDIYQEAMYTSWIKVRTNQYENQGTAKFSTYLFEIAKRKWWNVSRSSYMKKVIHTADQKDVESQIDYSSEPDDMEFKINILHQVIGLLDVNCQDILKQFYFDHKSYDEMATSLGKTPKTLKNQKFRCMGRLREKYLEEIKKRDV